MPIFGPTKEFRNLQLVHSPKARSRTRSRAFPFYALPFLWLCRSRDLRGMIHAKRNAERQDFTEKAWSLLPKHKFGWVQVDEALSVETTVPAADPQQPKATHKTRKIKGV